MKKGTALCLAFLLMASGSAFAQGLVQVGSDDFSYSDATENMSGGLGSTVGTANWEENAMGVAIVNGKVNMDQALNGGPGGGTKMSYFTGFQFDPAVHDVWQVKVDLHVPAEPGGFGPRHGLALHTSKATSGGSATRLQGSIATLFRADKDVSPASYGNDSGCCPAVLAGAFAGPTGAPHGPFNNPPNSGCQTDNCQGVGLATNKLAEGDYTMSLTVDHRHGADVQSRYQIINKTTGAIAMDESWTSPKSALLGNQAGIHHRFDSSQIANGWTYDNFALAAQSMQVIPLPAALPAGLGLIGLVGGIGLVRRFRKQ